MNHHHTEAEGQAQHFPKFSAAFRALFLLVRLLHYGEKQSEKGGAVQQVYSPDYRVPILQMCCNCDTTSHACTLVERGESLFLTEKHHRKLRLLEIYSKKYELLS